MRAIHLAGVLASAVKSPRLERMTWAVTSVPSFSNGSTKKHECARSCDDEKARKSKRRPATTMPLAKSGAR